MYVVQFGVISGGLVGSLHEDSRLLGGCAVPRLEPLLPMTTETPLCAPSPNMRDKLSPKNTHA